VAGKDINEVIRRRGERPSVIYVHCNYLSPDARIPPNGTVRLLPRATHAAFRSTRRIRSATSSPAASASPQSAPIALASNPDLSILAEMRFVHARHSDVSGAALLRMATHAGPRPLDGPTKPAA